MAEINSAEIGFEKEIWKAADKMRGNIDELVAEEGMQRGRREAWRCCNIYLGEFGNRFFH